VASLDADCTYDPRQLANLLPLLRPDVNLVVASPYHPLGAVENVPAWRLAISKLASRLYRLVLRNKLHTYTSCFRVYRRSAVIDLPLTSDGFVGIAELVWRLDAGGATIVECPAVLSVRRAGQSKLKIVRATLGHLRLLFRAACQRFLRNTSRPASPPLARSEISEGTLA
jgi:dolichol-phosphate mannosyltransferase